MYSGDMKLTKKIIFLLVVVAVATAAKKESEAVSSGVNYGDSVHNIYTIMVIITITQYGYTFYTTIHA